MGGYAFLWIAISLVNSMMADVIDEYELKWHWDEENRTIEAIETTDWEFQFDNELPISMNQSIYIPVGVIHRVIKGSGNLKLKIIKHK